MKNNTVTIIGTFLVGLVLAYVAFTESNLYLAVGNAFFSGMFLYVGTGMCFEKEETSYVEEYSEFKAIAEEKVPTGMPYEAAYFRKIILDKKIKEPTFKQKVSAEKKRLNNFKGGAKGTSGVGTSGVINRVK